MILVTGGTGFVGQALIRHLIASGKQVRTLLRPSSQSPQLPKGISVEAAVCSIRDERGLRAAMKDVDEVYYLAGTERHSSRADLQDVDIHGSEVVFRVARQTGVRKLVFLSHLGADRASAFPVFKAKAITENNLIRSDVPFTILRSGPIFGPGDQFTVVLAQLLRQSPGVFLVPGDGLNLIQPIWIEDLINCLMMAMDNDNLTNQTISIGGLEALPFLQVIKIMTEAMHIKRAVFPISPTVMRTLTLMLDEFTRFPVSVFWLDYLAVDRTTALDTVPKVFGILPARFHTQLDYLRPVSSRKR